MPNRAVVPAPLPPSVAAAVRRVEDWGWIIVINPSLCNAERSTAELKANQMIDMLKSGWQYRQPHGGVDVMVPSAVPIEQTILYSLPLVLPLLRAVVCDGHG